MGWMQPCGLLAGHPLQRWCVDRRPPLLRCRDLTFDVTSAFMASFKAWLAKEAGKENTGAKSAGKPGAKPMGRAPLAANRTWDE